MTPARGSHDRFATTRWSMVMQTASTLSADANSALTELAQRYWYPVYAYVRRCGHAPAIAQDITRTFLGCLMRRFDEGRERPPQTHFRRFLLEQLNLFLGSDWREVVENDASSELTVPADLEARNLRDNGNSSSPEQAYQHSFALEVITRALRQLQLEARQTGHIEMYDALQPFMAQDPVSGELQALARTLNCQPLTLAMAVKRLRQRFRELAAQELADTVASPDDLSAEQTALHVALKNIQAP